MVGHLNSVFHFSDMKPTVLVTDFLDNIQMDLVLKVAKLLSWSRCGNMVLLTIFLNLGGGRTCHFTSTVEPNQSMALLERQRHSEPFARQQLPQKLIGKFFTYTRSEFSRLVSKLRECGTIGRLDMVVMTVNWKLSERETFNVVMHSDMNNPHSLECYGDSDSDQEEEEKKDNPDGPNGPNGASLNDIGLVGHTD